MKKLFTLLSLSLSLSLVKADYWTQKADFGGAPRFGATGFSIGNNGYIGIGAGDATGSLMYSDFWEYNPLTNVWTQKANFSGSARRNAVGFAINNKGYIGTGYDDASVIFYNDFWEYDPSANTWIQKASISSSGRGGCIGFSIGNKGYIGTGQDLNNFLKDFWEYDPLVNSWTQKTDFGGTERSLGTGFSNGAKGYAGTGNGIAYENDFWEWDPGTNAWTQKATFGGTSCTEACAFWLCPYGYVGTGTTHIGSGTFDDFWKYNIANNIWTQVAVYGGGLKEMVAVFTIGIKAYVGTGWVNDQNPTNDFWEYTPDSACATGIEEELSNSNFQFSISPNLVKDYIVISYSLSGNENLEITITNAEGKKVYEKKLHASTSNFKLQTSNYPKGIYFAELSNGKYKAVKKFVKE